MHITKFKKRIVVESGVFLTVLLILAGGTYGLSMVNDDYADTNNQTKAKVDTIDHEYNDLNQKYNFIKQNLELYNDLVKRQSSGQLLIGRQLMFEKFNQFRSQYALTNLRLSVSPSQEVKSQRFKRKTTGINVSGVGVDLESMYDENVFQLINAMQHELSGVCIFSHVTLSIDKPLDDTVLKAIATNGTFPFVKASIKFNWFSINSLEVPDAGANDAKK